MARIVEKQRAPAIEVRTAAEALEAMRSGRDIDVSGLNGTEFEVYAASLVPKRVIVQSYLLRQING